MWVRGATLTNGLYIIDPIDPGWTSPNPGTEQFGIYSTQSGGTGNIVSRYKTVFFGSKLYSYGGTSTVADLFSSSAAASDDIYSPYYLANISSTTESGAYSTVLTYTVSGQF